MNTGGIWLVYYIGLHYKLSVASLPGTSDEQHSYVDKMRDATWATRYHCSSTDENPQHHKCPEGSKNWCFYQHAIADEKEPPLYATSQGHQLTENVANAVVHVHERMSDTNLLGRMVKGKTQNANESLHCVIWLHCPKTVFVGVRGVCGAVASAIARFNESTSHISQVIEKLAIERMRWVYLTVQVYFNWICEHCITLIHYIIYCYVQFHSNKI